MGRNILHSFTKVKTQSSHEYKRDIEPREKMMTMVLAQQHGHFPEKAEREDMGSGLFF